ncbi:hypothetical protein L2E82_21348 [Cichorium intybus]|uniref:Uncharacterized protein n=1 Tax=Cichorium intybus TaxID=13427 RepID=A0ACB9DVR2_CICIN|nr:hypothetical protein L2E82_21348 [Cichorium intybus]
MYAYSTETRLPLKNPKPPIHETKICSSVTSMAIGCGGSGQSPWRLEAVDRRHKPHQRRRLEAVATIADSDGFRSVLRVERRFYKLNLINDGYSSMGTFRLISGKFLVSGNDSPASLSQSQVGLSFPVRSISGLNSVVSISGRAFEFLNFCSNC